MKAVISMRKFQILFFAAIVLGAGTLTAQSGCPGCQIGLPDGLAADTVFLSAADTGQAGVFYDSDLSFRLPKTTDPVHAVDPSVPAGLTISHLTISSVVNLPPGLGWEASQTEFDPAEQTDGCVKVCGTPLQPGVFEVQVFITAQVLFISQTTSFGLTMVIEPAETVTEGFSMVNASGCGEVEVSFLNQVPSGGSGGFAYHWDFGDGTTSLDENPDPQVYSQPGAYPVNYRAIVDTAGYFLFGVSVDEVGCNDFLGGKPDLKVRIFNQAGDEIYLSAIVDNAEVPLFYTFTLELEDGNYSLQVVDDDNGIDGADDNCGIVNFTKTTTGQLTNDELKVTLNIFHQVDTIRSADTVRVFAQPDPPLVAYESEGPLCKGDLLTLVADISDHIQWYRDSSAIFEATDSLLPVSENGRYWLTYTSPDGCISTSAETEIQFGAAIENVVFVNQDNLLSIFDLSILPEQAGIQWQLDGVEIADANDPEYCIAQTGVYAVVITDLATGCQGSYSRAITYNPNFPNCMTPVRDLPPGISGLSVSPNPFSDRLRLRFDAETAGEMQLRLTAADGRQVVRDVYRVFPGENTLELIREDLPAGLYWLAFEWNGYLFGKPVLKR